VKLYSSYVIPILFAILLHVFLIWVLSLEWLYQITQDSPVKIINQVQVRIVGIKPLQAPQAAEKVEVSVTEKKKHHNDIQTKADELEKIKQTKGDEIKKNSGK